MLARVSYRLQGGLMLAGKTAIVTGSTSGIGLGIATGLAKAGTNVVLNGFGPADAIDKIVSDLKRQHNVGVLYSSANIADPDEIEDMVDQTRSEFGGVSWSTMPASNTSIRSRIFRSTSGTPSSRSTFRVHFTPAGSRCRT
jgi:NAD(P)-dependent dehydrogenase (short-subunit alcohol dehydrogenase family)